MPDDKHAKLRSLPFEMLAGALSIDISRFKRRKGDTEWAGPCPVHAPKKNGTAFSYSQDGKFNCFSCNAKGRGGLDLAMAVRGCGFQAAVELLEPYAAVPDMRRARVPQVKLQQVTATENPPFRGTYQKFAVESAWLKERGFLPETAKRYGVFQYENPSRKSAYNGSVLLKIAYSGPW